MGKKLQYYPAFFSHASRRLKFCFLVECLDIARWIDMKFGTDIRGLQRMNAADFGEALTFHLAPLIQRYVSVY